MQDPKRLKTRKPWYQRAMEMSTLCKILFIKSQTSITTTPSNNNPTKSHNNNNKLKKSTSLKLATSSFTRVCLCGPISSYNNNDNIFNVDTSIAPPRRSYSYPRSSTSSSTSKPYFLPPPHHSGLAPDPRVHSARHSVEGGRRIFRGKSLTDNVLMRRFVVEEEAMMQVRRRNQLEIIRRRAAARRRRIGPSPLSRMVLVEEEEE